MSKAAADGVAKELKDAVDKVLASSSTKKLVVAGPGAGKTTLFRQMLDASKGAAAEHLVITFINNLKSSLEKDLGDVAQVFTLHGYCQHLLYKHEQLRNGLSAGFKCYPGLVSLIKTDWEWLKKSSAPQFVKLMRDLSCSAEQGEFYLQRANYYDAVDFDDSVYRTRQQLANNSALVPDYRLVLVDEFQDFNKMEAGVIDLLANRNIEQCIRAIPPEEVQLAQKKNEPAALIIGSNPYRRQVEEHLIAVGLVQASKQDELTAMQQAYMLLGENPNSNLGWRIMFSVENQSMGRTILVEAAKTGQQLSDLIPDDYRLAKLEEAKKWTEVKAAEGDKNEGAEITPMVKVASFEGSKGMSAQYVFIVGLQSGDIPRNAADVQDIEICRFLVGLTRTKRKCELMTTTRFGNAFKKPSEFLSWIHAARFATKKINKTYWSD